MYRPISVTTVKVYDNDFILCKKPSKNTIIEEDPHYNSFIDKFNPTTDDSVEDDGDHNDNIEVVDDDDELEPDEDGKYEVKAIIGDKHERTSKGRIIKRNYIVEWVNGEITTEPIDNLDTCKELVRDYDRDNETSNR